MPMGKSIRVYLADATVTGVRYAELVNWTGQAIACPRSRLSELAAWPESAKPGVYLLFEARLGDAKPLACIGESENVAKRLRTHDRKKEFWSSVRRVMPPCWWPAPHAAARRVGAREMADCSNPLKMALWRAFDGYPRQMHQQHWD